MGNDFGFNNFCFKTFPFNTLMCFFFLKEFHDFNFALKTAIMTFFFGSYFFQREINVRFQYAVLHVEVFLFHINQGIGRVSECRKLINTNRLIILFI